LSAARSAGCSQVRESISVRMCTVCSTLLMAAFRHSRKRRTDRSDVRGRDPPGFRRNWREHDEALPVAECNGQWARTLPRRHPAGGIRFPQYKLERTYMRLHWNAIATFVLLLLAAPDPAEAQNPALPGSYTLDEEASD